MLCTHPESGPGCIHYGRSGRKRYTIGDIERAAIEANHRRPAEEQQEVERGGEAAQGGGEAAQGGVEG